MINDDTLHDLSELYLALPVDDRDRDHPKGIVETLRDRIAELEELEAAGSATPDTHEELVDLRAFLDDLYAISVNRAKRLH